MKRCLPLALSAIILAQAALSAEPAPAPSSPALQTLAEIRANLAKSSDDPAAMEKAAATTAKVLALVEKNTFTTGDELFAASELVNVCETRYRADRSRYELTLAAAAKGNPAARQRVAGAWDTFLMSIGRPVRTAVREGAKADEKELATPCVRAVLLDPEKARADAQATQSNSELQRIVDADQADRRAPSIDWKVVGPRDDERNRRTLELLASGDLHTGTDFANAALVMQHSDGFAGYEVAHELAVCSMLIGGPRVGRWLVAATYDRMLGSVGLDQRFATQYSGFGGSMALQPTDTFGIGDAERLALGCPTLDAAQHRDLNRKPAAAATAGAMQPVPVEELTREPGVVRDSKYGLAVTCPPGFSLVHAVRWGDQQNTLHFEAPAHPDAHPSLYYIAYHAAKPMTDDALVAWYRDEARKKEESRREGLHDYRNRPESMAARTIAGRPAFSWIADFTTPDGEKYVEYMVDVRTDSGNAFFFLQAPAADTEKLRPDVDALMAGITMPHVTP